MLLYPTVNGEWSWFLVSDFDAARGWGGRPLTKNADIRIIVVAVKSYHFFMLHIATNLFTSHTWSVIQSLLQDL